MTRSDRRAAGLITAATLFQCGWFVHAMRRLSGSPGGALDDAYIHFQYATQLARGHFFEWTPGGGYSTGATSVLWPVLLAPAYFVGLREERMAYFAAGLGAIALWLCAWFAYRMLSDALTRAWGALGAALVLTSGAFLWGLFGGMEVPLAAALAMGLLRAMQLGRRTLALVLAALLPLARPEWALITAVVVAFEWLERRRAGALLAFAPLGAYFALNLALTGRVATNGLLAKSLFHDPNLRPGGVYSVFSGQAIELLQDHLARLRLLPLGAPVLAVVGAIRPSRAIRLTALFALLSLLATITVKDAFRHYNRYQLPSLPLLLVAAVAGLAALVSLAADLRVRSFIAAVGSVVLLGFQLLFLRSWNDQLAHNCRDIFAQQVQMGRWMRDHLPKGSVIAVNDAGAIPLVSGLPAIDLVGLGSGEFSRAWREGEGAVYEALERLPPERRPRYFAIYPTWVKLFDLYGPEVHRVHIDDNRTAGEADKVLFQARLDGLGTGAQPVAAHEGRIVDEVDVADIESERAHDYAIERPNRTIYRREPSGVRMISEGGRVMHGFERFRVRVTPGRTARLVWRTDAWFAAKVRVLVDGDFAGRVELAKTRRFIEPEVVLPGALVRRARPEIRVELEAPSEMGSFHYWVMQ